MASLMCGDLSSTVAHPVRVSSSGEVFSRKLLEGARVEGSLKVLEGQSVVEHIAVVDIRLLDNRRGDGGRGEGDSGEDGSGETHCRWKGKCG